MEFEWDSRPAQHRVNQRAHWQDHPPPPVSFSPQTSPASLVSQRRRSSAANPRPANPPPNLPIPSLPVSSPVSQPPSFNAEVHDVPVYSSSPSSISRGSRSSSFARPAASPNLSAVAAFSQARQASSSTSHNSPPSMTSSIDDLSDPPPQSYLPSSSSRHSDRTQEPHAPPDRSLLVPPTEHSHRSEHRPSSRRALTRALELAREAVQLDSTNDNPEAAVNAYAQSVALLSEVMERVRNGEDSTSDSHRRRRRRSVAAQEEEVRRLQNIHDTYADRMNILSIIYSIPAVPYPASSLYSNAVSDSTTSNSPTTSASPSSDNSPHIPQQTYTPHMPEESESHSNSTTDYFQETDPSDAVYLDESVLRGSTISGLPSTQHPYSGQYDPPPQSQAASRSSISARRLRVSSNLPPKPPPPASSLPPAPTVQEPPSEPPAQTSWRQEPQARASEPTGHRRTPSGLGALEEESEDTQRLEIRSKDDGSDAQKFIAETPRNAKRESPPLPPLPTTPDATGTPRTKPLTRPPPSPRLVNVIVPRQRGSSQLTTRNELANVPQINATSQGAIFQRRKTSAPPSVRSASPSESVTSAGSIPPPAVPPPPIASTYSNGIIAGRHRSSSQPGRRPSIVGGRVSPDQRPPLPATNAVNGAGRKVSVPSKFNPALSTLQLDPSALQSNSIGFPANLPTTPTSPLPPAPPSDPLLKPYHMMHLLRTTMVSPTGGYVTRRLHVPCEVWSQGGAKLSNLDEKIRVVTILCDALEDLQSSSAEYFGAGSISSGLALGIGSIGRKEAEAWLSKLEDFSNVCVGVVTSFGKKLGVGEGFVSRKTTLGDKITRRLDKFTNGKNLDSPTVYVQGLRKLFSHVQLLDEHTRAFLSQPVAPAYAAFPVDIRASVEQKLKRFSEFFATVVLSFVIRDLSQLIDKYVKQCEKLLLE
ncbi:unnamed protein product [Cyclocybe aegerita]|uniref:MIT domain-containing protein n=1 Tax=Cyclocybe aegerita TaxID=1973307 RepID=A0A8S0WNG5_CYCAE|nr:unnamed protein product [Cyclocybe aegerita]